MDNAEAQFTTALRVSPCLFLTLTYPRLFWLTLLLVASTVLSLLVVLKLTTHQELWTYIVTNLASVYIREGNRHQEVSEGCNFLCLTSNIHEYVLCHAILL